MEERLKRIKEIYGFETIEVIEVEGYNCAVIKICEGYKEVIPFDKDYIYPMQRAELKYNFKR